MDSVTKHPVASSTSVLDRSIDLDTHEMIPFHMWGEFFGEKVASKLAGCETSPFFADNGKNTSVRPDILADDTEITYDNVWQMKGSSAPSAIDVGRRAEVMDAMGVDRGLLFPSFGLVGILMSTSPDFVAAVMGLGMNVEETRVAGLEAIAGYNDWVIRMIGSIDSNRVRPVALMLTETLESMMSQLRFLIDKGVKAVWIPSGTPPAGTSPADPALDPFWQLAADNDIAMLLHIGTDFTFVSSMAWTAGVEAFIPPRASAEFVLSPFAGTTAHLAAEHFIAALALGGVFERVPNLRLGAIELGAQWFGPLAERLDMWAGVFPQALRSTLSMKPSEYLARNVRVTPYHFEPVEEYFERYPQLQDCYAYASDYPHVEGGQDSKKMFSDRLANLDPEISAKFFAHNGAWLLP
ncbi:MAG: amidohydrolase [Ilumatobacteraceae bacterium]|nr:amidohydrolase [Ilumatobacteraceae bacterium]